MKKLFFTLAISMFIQPCAFATHYLDLTHELSENTHNWPDTGKYSVTKTYAENLPQGGHVLSRDYVANEHNGTHMDAPIHFAKGHVGVDKVSLSKLIGPAIRVDVSEKVKNNPDYQISVADFEEWEKQYGKIPANSIILLDTGYDKYWDDFKKYTGADKSDKLASKHFHFPGLDPKAADWLIHQRQIKAIGIDTFSIDYGQTKSYLSHQILTKNDIPIFENVCRLEDLPPNHFMVYALPMKIKDGTGAPLRISAEIQN